jgi:uncharacterized membrane protein (UPF0127 family)
MEAPKTAHIEVEGTDYKVQIADTPESRQTGLQGVESLAPGTGMLFIFDEPQPVSFWMKDTLIPLDIVYINEYGEVLDVYEGTPNSEEMLEGVGVKYVLEVNQDSGIKIGDDVDLSEVGGEDADDEMGEDDNLDPTHGIDPMDIQAHEEGGEMKPKMLVLNKKGEAQMELQGGERIFSRANTKTLVRLSKRAYKSKDDKDYKALGRIVFKYLDIQDNKEDDYVELPDKD